MMQIKTSSGLVNTGSRSRPVVSLAIHPKAQSGQLVTGVAIGLVFGFALGSVVALSIGDKSLLVAQHLWKRMFNTDTDNEQVHFELLLQ